MTTLGKIRKTNTPLRVRIWKTIVGGCAWLLLAEFMFGVYFDFQHDGVFADWNLKITIYPLLSTLGYIITTFPNWLQCLDWFAITLVSAYWAGGITLPSSKEGMVWKKSNYAFLWQRVTAEEDAKDEA